MMKQRSLPRFWLIISMLVSCLFSSPTFAAGNGLQASYWNFSVVNNSYQFPTSAPNLTRIDPVVNNNWGSGSPSDTIQRDLFAVRWEGSLSIDETGLYTFHTQSDDGIRLWVNNQLVIDNWTLHGPRWDNSTNIHLTSGIKYTIKMEFFERSGGAVARLHWKTPSNSTRRVIPQSQLYSTSIPQLTSITTASACSTSANDELSLHFNTDMKTGHANDSAEKVENYIISPISPNGLSILSASALENDPSTIKLKFNKPLDENTDYTLEVSSIVSATNIPFTPLTQTMSFKPTLRGDGLQANYWNSNVPSNSYNFPETASNLSRVDSTINFNWSSASPDPAINANNFAVRWEGNVTPTADGDYIFSTDSDDGVRLWVDNQLVIDNWTRHGTRRDNSSAISLIANQQYQLKMEFFENTGGAVARLLWKTPAASNTVVIPSSALYSCGTASSLKAITLWHMDEALWDGTPNEVIDSSTFDNHGTAINNATTASVTPAIPGEIGTCRYGQFDGVDDYITSPEVYSTLKGTASMSFWLRTTQKGNNTAWRAPGLTGIEQSGGTDDIFWGWLDASGRIGISVGNNYKSKSTIPINDGIFHHIVLTRNADTGAYQIFIDGSLNKSGITGKGVIGTAFSNIGRIEDTGGSPEYFKGDLDEVQLFKGVLSLADAQRLMAETHTCAITTEAAGFNCVATTTDPITGSLYTQLVNKPFTFDVVALQDTTPATLETNFDNSVDVELVDASTGGSCADYPALSPEINQSVGFNGIDGIASTSAITVEKAYKNLKCRVTDNTLGSSLVSCSSDAFSVRPDKFTVTSILNNSGNSGSPLAKAGTDFSITASTNIENYNGTPIINSALITAHSSAIQTGILTGSFPAADPVTGNTTGTTFTYSEVGNFKIEPEGLIDNSYTAIDQSSDCVSGSSSNTLDADGKYGCNIVNDVASEAIGRFTPDHFKVTNATPGVFEHACSTGGFSYNDERFTYKTHPTLTVTAYNAASPAAITQNYTGDFLKLSATDFSITPPTMDANQLGADDINNVSLDWVAGAATLTDNADGSHTFTSGNDIYRYRREANNLIAPFTSNVNLDFTAITDSDEVQTQDLTYSLASTGTQIRYGRLAITNAHGSELSPLDVPFYTEFFTGLAWAVNTIDSCTSVNTSSNFNYAEHGIILVPNLLPATATLTLANGKSALPFGIAGEDNTGYIDITGSLDSWLQFDWNGDGSDENPTGRATFGIFKGRDKIIFRRELY